MNERSLTQEYYILTVNENGYMPVMNKNESDAGLIAAGVMELLQSGVITIEKIHGFLTVEQKKISVVKELPEELNYLTALYDYLQEKQRSISSLMSSYVVMGSGMQKLIEGIGETLQRKQAVSREKGGLFGNKTVYIPKEDYKREIVQALKTTAAGVSQTPHDMALLILLKESKNLNRYFSESERKELKEKLKELKTNPDNKELSQMVHYVDDMASVIAALLLTGML